MASLIDFSTVSDSNKTFEKYFEKGFVFSAEFLNSSSRKATVNFVTKQNSSIYTGKPGIQTEVDTLLIVEREDGLPFQFISVDGAIGDNNWDSAPFDFFVSVVAVLETGERRRFSITDSNISNGELLALESGMNSAVKRLEFYQGAIWHQYTNFQLKAVTVDIPNLNYILALLIPLIIFLKTRL